MVISDILFENFDGVASKHYDPIVGTLVCSSPAVSPTSSLAHVILSKNGCADSVFAGVPEHYSQEYQHHCTKWKDSAMDVQESEHEQSSDKLCVRSFMGSST